MCFVFFFFLSFLYHLQHCTDFVDLGMYADYVPVSVTHRTLTWGTGSLTCIFDFLHVYIPEENYSTDKSALEVDLGDRKNRFLDSPDAAEIRTFDFMDPLDWSQNNGLNHSAIASAFAGSWDLGLRSHSKDLPGREMGPSVHSRGKETASDSPANADAIAEWLRPLFW